MRTTTVAALAMAVLFGCGDDDEECVGDCFCHDEGCVCPDSGDCEVLCDEGCDLACTGSGDCVFECGVGCLVECPGSGICRADVGPDSSVACTGSGGCDVLCEGDCEVDCPGSGECLVECMAGATCTFARCDDLLQCPDGRQVCNGACP